MGYRGKARGITGAALLALFSLLAASAQAGPIYLIRPPETDPSLQDFGEPNVAIPAAKPGVPLAVFLPGTGGKPQNAMELLRSISGQGYAVIGLEYDDEPAVVQVCPRDPNPACSAQFREMRLYGKAKTSPVSNTPAASITGRLTSLLTKLAKDHPDQGWAGYLKDGAPDWSKVVLTGQSQGAGMAAYVAKQTPVARVVLFSSPWDFTQPGRRLADWIGRPSATPPERWYGAYNAGENTADLLKLSYQALRIPPDHIRVFTLDLPKGANPSGGNPYHGAGIHDTRYLDQWKFLFGQASPAD